MPLLKTSDSFWGISPFTEMGAYEALWDTPKASFKTIADRFRSAPDFTLSDLVPESQALDYASRVRDIIRDSGCGWFGLRINGAGEYPTRLRDAQHPLALLYYQGAWELTETPCVSVVGTRNPSPEGISRTRKLVKLLVHAGYTVISGLASGVDTVAHRTAIDAGGQTIAVIGTPISSVYPKENSALQREIAERFLLISQVPVYFYHKHDFRINRTFFPERNKTMSALSLATVIVEAGETSGTLVQARAAIAQGRKIFILNNCFENPNLTWPARFEQKGAVRVRDFEQILGELGSVAQTAENR